MRPTCLAVCAALAACAPSLQRPPPVAMPASRSAPAARPVPPTAQRHPEACSRQLLAVQQAEAGGDRERQLAEVKRLASICADGARRDMPAAAGAEWRGRTALLLRQMMAAWRPEAAAGRGPRARLARDAAARLSLLYGYYVALCPHEADAYDVAFARAELLFGLEEWDAAADAYLQVAKMRPDGSHLKEAAHGAVLAAKNHMSVDDSSRGAQGRRPLSARARRFVEACQLYLKAAPDTSERVSILYRVARVYYEHDQHAEAVDRFAEIVTRHASHQLATYAANLLLDSLNIGKRYDELERWVLRMLAEPLLTKDKEFAQTLRSLRSACLRKRVEQLTQQKKYRECGELYADMIKSIPDDPRLAQFLYNGALCFELAALDDKATALRRQLIKKKPRDPLAARARFMLAASYEKQQQPGLAAEELEELARLFPAERDAPEWLVKVIALRLRLNQRGKARAAFERLRRTYGAHMPQVIERARALLAQ